MSIIINVANRSKENSMIFDNAKTDEKLSSSLIKDTIIKQEKIEQASNLVATNVTENSNKNFSKTQIIKDSEKLNTQFYEINNQIEINSSESKRRSEKNSVSVDLQINMNNSMISSGSYSQKGLKSKSHHGNSYYNSNTSEKKQTLQTLTEINICDEIEVAEAEAGKCIERMENLNDLSNILKNKRINQHTLYTKNIYSTGNQFVFNKIVKNNSSIDPNYKTNNKYTTEPNTIGYNNKGLDYGFIQDELNNPEQPISHASIGINNRLENSDVSGNKGELNRSLTVSNGLAMKKKKEEEKLQKITNKLENIMHSYHNLNCPAIHTSLSQNNVIKKNEPNGNSFRSEDKNDVKLTCFQRLCGGSSGKK